MHSKLKYILIKTKEFYIGIITVSSITVVIKGIIF